MFDEQFYQQENSLDLLIKFSNQTQNSHQLSQTYYELQEKDQFTTGPHFDIVIEQFERESDRKDLYNDELLRKMRDAAKKQEDKMIAIKRKRKDSIKSLVESKRVMGQETQISVGHSKRRRLVKKGRE